MPCTIHAVLTDDGTWFVDTLPIDEEAEAAADARWAARGGPRIYRVRAFARVRGRNGIEHRLAKPRHPWTNGQVERMIRTLADATVRRCHCDSHDQPRAHLQLFLDACNHARRLKTPRGLTPREFVCRAWTEQPSRFRVDPTHLTPGLNI